MSAKVVLDAARSGVELYVKDGNIGYRGPKSSMTPELKEQILNNKAGIVHFLNEMNRAPKMPPVTKCDTNKGLLSFAQQRLWLLDRIDGGSAHYNVPMALMLSGKLNIEALRRAISSIVERHESLRTCFGVTEEGKPFQIIQAAAPIEVPLTDLSMLAPAEREPRMAEYVSAQALKPFNLSCDLMLRAQLIKLAQDEHILLVTMHHIASDGWSIAILINEFSALYRAYARGEVSPLPELEVQYADYAHWQRSWLQGEVLDQQLQYWTDQLANLPVVHSLPMDRPRPKMQSFVGETYQCEIAEPTARALGALCQTHGATLFMGLHAAFSVLLSRYSNETDIVVGSPIANREQAEVANLIGFFVNSLVLRSDLSGDPSFKALLEQSKAMLLQAYAHQQVPFEQLVERIQPERSLSHGPLFQIMLVLQNNEQGVLELPGLKLGAVKQTGAVAKYELTLTVDEIDQHLQLSWAYNTDLFDASTIEGMAGHFQTLLSALVAEPEQSVFRANMLNDAERAEILVGRNETASHYPSHLCLHDLFEAQARRRPDAIAVVSGANSLTYAELDRRADQLALRLIDLGVEPDTLVGICMERSCDMLVGLLGIAKSGAAYVPIDPDYPRARVEHMLVDSGVQIVVCDVDLVQGLPLTNQHVLHVQGEGSQDHDIAADPRTKRHPGLTSDHLAYVIYTSGSTGKPKGIAVQHKGLTNFLHSMARQPGFTPEDQLLAVTTISFDIAALELYLPLVCGGRVILLPREDSVDGNILIDRLATYGPSVMQATPATWQMLLNVGWKPAPGMKLLCGGEAMPPSLKDALLANGARLYNMFGPTETTIWSTLAAMHEEDDVYIGHPIDNTQVYVLDSKMCPVPDGAMGELCIGGDGVARGYWNRPELTAERFVPDPFSNQPGRHIYRTGDLARWRSDHSLEHLGRLDHQVKIRGYRIELGEIEAVLASHTDVADLAVTVHEDERSAARLMACLVMRDGRPLVQADLREFMELQLPPFMVPSVWIGLPVIPRTPNGKVDRAALPRPDGSEASAETTSVAPRNALELQIATIWEQILGVSGVGIRDSFFERGGQSLLAVQLMALIKDRFTCRVPLASFLQSPTVEQLALLVKQSSSTASVAESPLVPLQPKGDGRPLFLVPGVGGNVIYFRDLALLVGPELPVYGLQAKGLDGKSAPLDDVQAMATHHLKALRTIQPQGPYRLGGHSFGVFVALEMARQLYACGEQVERLVVLDQPVPTREAHAAPDAADLAGTLVDIAFGIGISFGKTLRLSRESFEGLDRDAQIAVLHRCLVEAEILSAGFDMADVRAYVDVWQAGMLAQQRYRLTEDAPRMPVTLCRAAEFEMPEWVSGELAETLEDPAWGWQRISAGPVDLHKIPGAHITMLSRPHVQSLAQVLTRTLPSHALADSALASASSMHQPTIS